MICTRVSLFYFFAFLTARKRSHCTVSMAHKSGGVSTFKMYIERQREEKKKTG